MLVLPINTDIWNLIEGKTGKEHEIQYYKPDNCSITNNGELRISVKRETLIGSGSFGPDNDWGPETFYATSGSVKSNVRFSNNDWHCVIARIKVEESQGIKPAFWLFNGNSYNEIDIFEYVDKHPIPQSTNWVTRPHATILNDRPDDQHPRGWCAKDLPDDNLYGWHVWACFWNNHAIAIWRDGVKVLTWYRFLSVYDAQKTCPEGQLVAESLVFPRDPMEIKFNLKVTDLELMNQTADMYIDYIRYYTAVNCTNVIITDPSQIPNTPGVYNVISGQNVTIDIPGGYTMGSDQWLKILASESIEIKPNFTGNKYLQKEVRNGYCSEGNPSLSVYSGYDDSTIFDESIYDERKDLPENKGDISSEFQIIPNPATDIVTIQNRTLSNTINNPNLSNINGFDIQIVNSVGKIVKIVHVDTIPIQISIADLSTGIYNIQIYSQGLQLHKTLILIE